MDFRFLTRTGAGISVPFGLAFLLAPALTAAQYGIALDTPAQAVPARYFGLAMLAQAALLWSLSTSLEGRLQRRVALAFGAVTSVGLALCLQVQLAGTVNASGWLSVAIYGFFSIGWGRLAWAPARSIARA